MAAAASIIFKRATRGGLGVLTKKFFPPKLAPSISICSSRAFNTWGHFGSLHNFLAKSEGWEHYAYALHPLDNNNALYFEFVMPGLGKEDVEVDIEENNMLSFKGKYSSGITCGHRILLGTNKCIMRDEITAEMKNGVLKVKVPKMKDEEKKNVIKVNVV
ncbi:hypothetical protein AQUCO_04200041v1 [Aquilegia coerulea]|uniref:SHSP domain-containing protein n=1 Tax=Aquilegia coerulea TaxID=218851 RepID=A0A2G5CP53_AQUCA|nr:hypothetical protein AQUCO_04200041v1 [Aquilegia coerulea]